MDRNELKRALAEEIPGMFKAAFAEIASGGGTSPEVSAAIRAFNVGRPEEKAPEPGLVIGRVVRALANVKCDPHQATLFAKSQWGDRGEFAMYEAVEKAMSAGTAAAGGFLLGTEMATTIVDYLDARAVVRRAGPMKAPLDTGSMNFPKLTGGPSASYIGESGRVDSSNVSTGQVNLIAKELAALVPITNRLLIFGGALADTIARNSLVRSLSNGEDRAFLRGTGSEFSPKGMRYRALAANITESNGDDLAGVAADLMELMQALEGGDVLMERPYFFVNTRSKNHLLFNVRDGNGNPVYAADIRAGQIGGVPYAATNNVPANLGDEGDESEVILADMAQAVIGEASQIMLSASDSATFVDEEGATISCFQQNMTLVRATIYNDFAMLQDEAVAVKTGVTWGA